MGEQEYEYLTEKKNNNELENMFIRFPNWSRWILALPFAYLGWLISRFAFNWSYARFVGYFAEYMELLFESTGGIAAFIYIFYSVIPKRKFIITLVVSIMLGILYTMSGTLSIYSGEYLGGSLTVTILVYILSLITIVLICIAIYKDEKKQKEHSQ